MVIASIGEVHHEHIIYANKLEPGDAVIGLRSSGIHSNGISLARKVLFKQWGGKYEPFDVPEGFDRELVYEVLEPTKIYVKPFLKLRNTPGIKAAIHITGDAYQKFDKLMRFNTSIGFEFDNFKPQPIFSLLKAVAKQQKRPISDEEMFRTFNMGWGFAVIVPNASKIDVMESLKRSGIETSQIGKVTGAGNIVVKYDRKKIALI